MPGRRISVARRPAVVEGGRIGSMTHEGKGIADNDGKKVFVSGALPGELVDYQPVKRRRSYDEAVVAGAARSVRGPGRAALQGFRHLRGLFAAASQSRRSAYAQANRAERFAAKNR